MYSDPMGPSFAVCTIPQVSIRASSMLCGGSIIDASHILSAGHCFYTPGGPPDPETIRVFAGQAVMYSGTAHKVSIRTETMSYFKCVQLAPV
jgi:secreted trypsin-like serine protease